jgi:hypothetical protein
VVCVYCRTILLVTDGPVLYRVATQAELDDLPRELWAELHTIVTMLERYADCAGHKPLS